MKFILVFLNDQSDYFLIQNVMTLKYTEEYHRLKSHDFIQSKILKKLIHHVFEGRKSV